jgi:hypothetical protein
LLKVLLFALLDDAVDVVPLLVLVVGVDAVDALVVGVDVVPVLVLPLLVADFDVVAVAVDAPHALRELTRENITVFQGAPLGDFVTKSHKM